MRTGIELGTALNGNGAIGMGRLEKKCFNEITWKELRKCWRKDASESSR